MAEKTNRSSCFGEIGIVLAEVRDRVHEKIKKKLRNENYAVGIDLGTTNSCVAVCRNGKVEVIANEQGSRIIPSYVAYTNTEILIGGPAKTQASTNPKNTIYDAKRMIGRNYDDLAIRKKLSTWQFDVVENKNKPKIKILHGSENKSITPEVISASLLKNIRKFASRYLDHNVKKAVITVPAYFNNSQRQATIDAGKMAGFKNIKLINEPTAAAIAYGFGKENEEKNILVYDLGGGTLDVSVLKTKGNKFDVKAVSGDTDFGGRDLDKLLVDYVVEYMKNNKGVDLSKNSRAMNTLLQKCEIAKENLSFAPSTKIIIEKIQDDVDVNLEITRSRFEDLCEDLLEKTLASVEKVLSASKLSKEDIDEVVLVGGSTRIPKVQSILLEFFDGKELNKSLNPDEAVAFGAAVMANGMGSDSSLVEVGDVIPMSLGIHTKGGYNSKVIEANSKIPVKTTAIFCTASDFQEAVRFNIQEGESKFSKDTCLLGYFVLHNITIARAFQTQMKVTFNVDSNGILRVSALEPKSASFKKIEVHCYNGRQR